MIVGMNLDRANLHLGQGFQEPKRQLGRVDDRRVDIDHHKGRVDMQAIAGELDPQQADALRAQHLRVAAGVLAPDLQHVGVLAAGAARLARRVEEARDGVGAAEVLNDMLTVHVVHKPTKRSAKLHFLTREAMQVKTMLTRYAEAVLQELQNETRGRLNQNLMLTNEGKIADVDVNVFWNVANAQNFLFNVKDPSEGFGGLNSTDPTETNERHAPRKAGT